LKWLKTILKIHSSYLMSCPSSEDLLGPFMSLLRTREVLYPQMCQLRGKLELIKGNIEAKQHRDEPSNEALLDFHDGMFISVIFIFIKLDWDLGHPASLNSFTLQILLKRRRMKTQCCFPNQRNCSQMI